MYLHLHLDRVSPGLGVGTAAVVVDPEDHLVGELRFIGTAPDFDNGEIAAVGVVEAIAVLVPEPGEALGSIGQFEAVDIEEELVAPGGPAFDIAGDIFRVVRGSGQLGFLPVAQVLLYAFAFDYEEAVPFRAGFLVGAACFRV